MAATIRAIEEQTFTAKTTKTEEALSPEAVISKLRGVNPKEAQRALDYILQSGDCNPRFLPPLLDLLYHQNQGLKDRLSWIRKQAQDFDADTNVVVRKPSEWVSGAGEYREAFQAELLQIEEELECVNKALRNEAWQEAYASLKKAEAGLLNLDTQWRKYVRVIAGGAESVTKGLVIVRNGSFGFAAGGGIGLALGVGAGIAGSFASAAGLHAGLLSIPAPESFTTTSKEIQPEKVEKNSKDEGSNSQTPDPAPAQPEELSFEERVLAAIKDTEKPLEPGIKKDTATLLAEATRALTEWKKDFSVVHEYGNFFLQIEAPDKMSQNQLLHFSELQIQWKENAAVYKAGVEKAQWGEKVGVLIDKLFEDYLTLYVRNNANLSDILDGRGGSCEAQTKLIIASVTASGIKLPKNQRLAVQVFEDHVQAVIYDQNKGTVFNLLKLQEINEIQAPLYDPHYFFHVYLTSQNKPSPVSLQSLLIVDADKKPTEKDTGKDGAPYSYSTNSKLKFSGSKGIYSSGPVPESAYIAPPSGNRSKNLFSGGKVKPKGDREENKPRDIEKDGLDYFSERIQEERVMSKNEAAKLCCWDVGSQEWLEKDSSELGFAWFGDYSLVKGSTAPVLLFQDEEKANYYNNLPDANAKFSFLMALLNQRITQYLTQVHSKDKSIGQIGIEIFKNPSLIKEEGGEKVAVKIIETIEDIRQMFYQTKFSPALLREKNPSLRAFDQAKESFYNRLKEKPLDFVLFMDQLTYPQRFAFMHLTKLADRPQDVGEKLREIIVNPNLLLLGVEEKPAPKLQDAYIPIMEIDLSELPEIDLEQREEEVDPKNETGWGGSRKEGDTSGKEEDAPYRIKAETMIDLIMFYDAFERWDSSLAKKFREINHDCRYVLPFFEGFTGRDNYIYHKVFAFWSLTDGVRYFMAREFDGKKYSIPKLVAAIKKDFPGANIENNIKSLNAFLEGISESGELIKKAIEKRKKEKIDNNTLPGFTYKELNYLGLASENRQILEVLYPQLCPKMKNQLYSDSQKTYADDSGSTMDEKVPYDIYLILQDMQDRRKQAKAKEKP